MCIRRIAVLAAAFFLVTGSLAVSLAVGHEAAKGRNGGWRVDAGAYHAELIVDGTTRVTVYLSDTEDRPIPAQGFKANAIFIIGGKSERFPLLPAEGSKMVGTAPAPVPSGAKGVIQLIAPDGKTAQGKF